MSLRGSYLLLLMKPPCHCVLRSGKRKAGKEQEQQGKEEAEEKQEKPSAKVVQAKSKSRTHIVRLYSTVST